MPQSLLDPKLLKKLAEKLEKTEKYAREQVCKKASNKKVSSEAYLVHWLSQFGVSAATYRRSLSPIIQEEIRHLSALEPVQEKGARPVKTVRGKDNILKTRAIDIKAKPDLLPKEMINSAYRNIGSYQVVFIFENTLRNFIITVMEKEHGSDWWKKVKNNIKSKVEARERKEKLNPWYSGKRGIHPIHYTDFSDLANILRANIQYFSAFFKEMPGGLGWLTQKLDELYFARNNIAHMAPIKKEDEGMLSLYFKKWYLILDKLNSEIKIKK